MLVLVLGPLVHMTSLCNRQDQCSYLGFTHEKLQQREVRGPLGGYMQNEKPGRLCPQVSSPQLLGLEEELQQKPPWPQAHGGPYPPE